MPGWSKGLEVQEAERVRRWIDRLEASCDRKAAAGALRAFSLTASQSGFDSTTRRAKDEAIIIQSPRQPVIDVVR